MMFTDGATLPIKSAVEKEIVMAKIANLILNANPLTSIAHMMVILKIPRSVRLTTSVAVEWLPECAAIPSMANRLDILNFRFCLQHFDCTYSVHAYIFERTPLLSTYLF